MTIEDDDLEWELDHGVPQFEDPFIQKYLDGRDALIEQEQKRRHGQFFSQPLFIPIFHHQASRSLKGTTPAYYNA